MGHPYYDIAFTERVRALQARDGSRALYGGADDEPGDARLGRRETEFIEAADHFFQATVGETGWPYVQHRGGPAGFLKVLDAQTIGFADLAGNRQFISLGNLAHDERIALIIMDWVAKRRIKLMGRVRVVPREASPALLARLAMPGYGKPQRAFLITVEGYDWNCPQHITQRYTRAAVEQVLSPLEDQVSQLRRALAEATRRRPAATGAGPLRLVVRAMRQATPRARVYELATADGAPLPQAAPGAHLEVPVHFEDGQVAPRQYYIMPLADDPGACEIAVQCGQAGGGAPAAIHAQWELGLVLRLEPPRNHFPLHGDTRPALLLAAGIGIAPLRAMAQRLHAEGRAFSLHAAAHDQHDVALMPAPGPRVWRYVSEQGQRMPVELILSEAPADSVVYVCGPKSFVERAAVAAQLHSLELRAGCFSPPGGLVDGTPV